MVVGCEEAAGASAAASGCCPPRPSQGIAPGSVRPCWPPGCLQRRRGCGRGVRRAQLTGWARVVLAGWRLTVWPWLLLLLSRLSVADGTDGQGSRRVSTTPHARRSTQILATGAAPICCRPACLISGRSAASQLGPAPSRSNFCPHRAPAVMDSILPGSQEGEEQLQQQARAAQHPKPAAAAAHRRRCDRWAAPRQQRPCCPCPTCRLPATPSIHAGRRRGPAFPGRGADNLPDGGRDGVQGTHDSSRQEGPAGGAADGCRRTVTALPCQCCTALRYCPGSTPARHALQRRVAGGGCSLRRWPCTHQCQPCPNHGACRRT